MGLGFSVQMEANPDCAGEGGRASSSEGDAGEGSSWVRVQRQDGSKPHMVCKWGLRAAGWGSARVSLPAEGMTLVYRGAQG